MFVGIVLSHLWLLLVVTVDAHKQQKDFEARCRSFKPEKHVKNATRNVLEYVAPGTNLTLRDNVASCNRNSQVVPGAVCRIALSIPTSHRSSITFELWLPEKWEGRFLATGNGGVDGCIRYEDLAYGSQNGFATAGANNGHNGTTLITALNNDDVVEDYAHRSLHTTAQVGKKLARKFYRKSHKVSYYIGCSLGGRQGIDAADKYPADYDAILAGAPAVDFNNLYSWRGHFPLNTSTDYIPPESWRTFVHDEVLRQCDALDGVHDNVIEDPLQCNSDPAKLLCSSSSQTTNCLTPQQIHPISKIYQPYTYPNKTLIYPPLQPGAEIAASTGVLSGQPFSLSVEWFKYIVYNNPSWDPYTFSTADASFAELKNPGNIRTWPKDFRAFRQRGGRLVMYHGLQDQQITSFNTPRFYERMRNATGKSYGEMDEWVRYFRISGMGHCNSGPGGWVLGQLGGASAAGISFEAKENVFAALVEWVEKGRAPETVLGTKFVDDTVELGVQLRRRHCKWPLTNKSTEEAIPLFRGAGNVCSLEPEST
ncbi:putative feruloyl esterase B-2 [Cercospora beticola]|uniref:Carboxylic ester hydrolase n=1 Tax=Cercospora beticola TaxID=122368 RepID=A0A2G5HH87_CERBT|nr:putative feruloyl esterase B-2 [Cercospora beticola]PIA91593.1 putative feruloyl esterase B-2 [Cercospora beticola]WPB06462.1 hypothetical protein RHO25_011119 [Cercospora beticola]